MLLHGLSSSSCGLKSWKMMSSNSKSNVLLSVSNNSTRKLFKSKSPMLFPSSLIKLGVWKLFWGVKYCFLLRKCVFQAAKAFWLCLMLTLLHTQEIKQCRRNVRGKIPYNSVVYLRVWSWLEFASFYFLPPGGLLRLCFSRYRFRRHHGQPNLTRSLSAACCYYYICL